MASEIDTSAEAVERRAAWADGNADIFAVVALGRDGLREDQSHTDKLMERHKQHKEQAATLRALAAPAPFPKPRRQDGRPPCGECHLQPGEICDICGATPAPEAAA